MRIPGIPYLAWLSLFVLFFATSALANGGEEGEQQIAAELRQVAAFERSVQRALEQNLGRSLGSLVAQELESQNELLAQVQRHRRPRSAPASPAAR